MKRVKLNGICGKPHCNQLIYFEIFGKLKQNISQFYSYTVFILRIFLLLHRIKQKFENHRWNFPRYDFQSIWIHTEIWACQVMEKLDGFYDFDWRENMLFCVELKITFAYNIDWKYMGYWFFHWDWIVWEAFAAHNWAQHTNVRFVKPLIVVWQPFYFLIALPNWIL